MDTVCFDRLPVVTGLDGSGYDVLAVAPYFGEVRICLISLGHAA